MKEDLSNLLDKHEARLRMILKAVEGRVIPMPDGVTDATEQIRKSIGAVSHIRKAMHLEPDKKEKIQEAREKYEAALEKRLKPIHQQITDLKQNAKKKRKHAEALLAALKIKTTNLHKVSQENRFIRDRIKQIHGPEEYQRLMNTVNNPTGFDAENFKKTSESKAAILNELDKACQALFEYRDNYSVLKQHLHPDSVAYQYDLRPLAMGYEGTGKRALEVLKEMPIAVKRREDKYQEHLNGISEKY